eukprot:TRINITY_DN20224_c0_g3_i2.p1 TRINITY_DN20224_c0_g3~~TRINITY_DN20224_c0_g3_i2.p1  ORF type:complete len:585 (-),score=116.81 TRINITY_DN20224_c0_g3_i2:212-1966(-)
MAVGRIASALRIASEDVTHTIVGALGQEGAKASRLVAAVKAGDVRAVRQLAKGGVSEAAARIPKEAGDPPLGEGVALHHRLSPQADRPLLIEALRKRPLHKLNTLFKQAAKGCGPDPETLVPLAGDTAITRWKEAAHRETLEGETFVRQANSGDTLDLHELGGGHPRVLASCLAVAPEEVEVGWHAWQFNMAGALLGTSRSSSSSAGKRGAKSLSEHMVHAADYKSRTAMHYAAACGNVPLVHLLLECGAAPGTQDQFGRTPAHVAALYRQQATLEALQEATAAASSGNAVADCDGLTAADIAADAAAGPSQGSRSREDVARMAVEVAKQLKLPTDAQIDSRIDVVDASGGAWPPDALERALRLQKPLLVRAGADAFPASETWTLEGLDARLGATRLRPNAWWQWRQERESESPAPDVSTLSEFIERFCRHGGASAPSRKLSDDHDTEVAPYAFETPTGDARKHLVQDVPLIPETMWAKCALVRYPQIAVGLAGAGAPAHAHAAAVNALIVGVKRWRLSPPSGTRWSVEPIMLDGEPAKHGEIEIIQEAGDIVVVPEFWGHSTVLLTDCVAATYEVIHETSLWS